VVAGADDPPTHRKVGETMMRKLIAIATVVLMLALTAVVVSADSPRFSRVSSSTDSSGNLLVSFRETGLGNTPNPVNYSLTGTASATYVCINGGGNHPKATNKATINSTFSVGAQFLPENGVVEATIESDVPGAGSFSCPGGQRLELSCVTYSDILITDTDHDVSTDAPDASYSDPVYGRFCP
jgi:hypothetical protein